MKRCKRHGILCWKFESPSTNHVPDRLLIARGVPITMAELKRPGGKPRPAQAALIETLRALGVEVRVIDTIEDAEGYADELHYRSVAASFEEF